MVHLTGSCHCRAVSFSVEAPEHLVVYKCNCSICILKQNHHFIVPQANFALRSGENVLTEYFFNTRAARHLFCSICGVQAFYVPRSNPDGYAVTIYCIEGFENLSIEWREFDGKNWEKCYAESNIAMRSKVD